MGRMRDHPLSNYPKYLGIFLWNKVAEQINPAQ